MLVTDLPICNDHTVFHVGDVIRKLRTRKGWDLRELARRADQMSLTTLSELERGKGNQRKDTLERVATALGTTVEELYAQLSSERPALKDEPESIDVDVTNYVKADIPVLGPAEATTDGLIAWSDEGVVRNQVEGWISRPSWIRDKKAYGLVVRGESMVPRYFPGELIIASPNAIVTSGSFACVILRSGARMIKRVYRQETGWNLISINERFEPMFVSDEDVVAIHKIVHNSQDAVAVAQEAYLNQKVRSKVPRSIRRFAERHDGTPDHPDEMPEAAYGDDDDDRGGE